jgi:hypothetical protein
MKNQLLIAMAAVAFLLFMANGASAQICLDECIYQGTAGITAHQSKEGFMPAVPGEAMGTQEFVPASPGSEEMSLAREKTITGLDAAPRGTHEDYGVSYSSQFERRGFP